MFVGLAVRVRKDYSSMNEAERERKKSYIGEHYRKKGWWMVMSSGVFRGLLFGSILNIDIATTHMNR